VTVAELVRILKRVNQNAIVVLEHGVSGAKGVALRGVDIAGCRADVVDSDGGIREMTTECVLPYPAPTSGQGEG
jgi:hypothetical protein